VARMLGIMHRRGEISPYGNTWMIDPCVLQHSPASLRQMSVKKLTRTSNRPHNRPPQLRGAT
jgi:hypothetical protein